MAPPSIIAALVALLRADAAIAALVGTRVFGIELAPGQAADMPRKAIVISPSGGAGFGSQSYVRTRHPRIDIRCYGESFAEADAVHWTVFERLKHLHAEDAGGVRFYAIAPESESLALREPEGDWPLMLSVWNATTSEHGVAA